MTEETKPEQEQFPDPLTPAQRASMELKARKRQIATKPEQDAMTPGRRAYETYEKEIGHLFFTTPHKTWRSMHPTEQAAWEAAAAAVIADATKGGE